MLAALRLGERRLRLLECRFEGSRAWQRVADEGGAGGVGADADDGIDRHDGFGREVWVDDLRPVGDGPWPELEVAFGLAVPDERRFRDVPRSGTVRMPFGREGGS